MNEHQEAIEGIAVVAHNVIRRYKEFMGQELLPAWPDLDDDSRRSSLLGVEFLLENPGVRPGTLHDMWVAHKMETGWTLGDVLDREKKTHPNLKMFEELHPYERLKDTLFMAAVEGTIMAEMVMERHDSRIMLPGQ